jgi:hypothetical protein
MIPFATVFTAIDPQLPFQATPIVLSVVPINRMPPKAHDKFLVADV